LLNIWVCDITNSILTQHIHTHFKVYLCLCVCVYVCLCISLCMSVLLGFPRREEDDFYRKKMNFIERKRLLTREKEYNFDNEKRR